MAFVVYIIHGSALVFIIYFGNSYHVRSSLRFRISQHCPFVSFPFCLFFLHTILISFSS
ncbi:hypothetical protein BDV40DRAFT_265967 [Aspergillus tamarii]|uniref:Uncharacterized protein n=1 Tax=Aspergillus tamarii TaxID=41984 RepID=A0A5N6UVS2_ASPTM|nr:hypothetical protein BDV40DRAFT_265967 [Aspergillus tamarii]